MFDKLYISYIYNTHLEICNTADMMSMYTINNVPKCLINNIFYTFTTNQINSLQITSSTILIPHQDICNTTTRYVMSYHGMSILTSTDSFRLI